MKKKDFNSVKTLYDLTYVEYLAYLKQNDPQQYLSEIRDRRVVSLNAFNYFLKNGFCFVAVEKDRVVGYVASQTVLDIHGNRLLWIEFITVEPENRRQGMATQLLKRLVVCAKLHNINRIYSTINPDNQISINLHRKIGFDVNDWKVATLTIE